MAEQVGFFTDTTLCIGCKACQVACKEWNDLPAQLQSEKDNWPDGVRRALPLTGDSYDNTRSLSDVNWRHVKFIEQFSPDANRTQAAWLMMSDVCKHCKDAPCLDVCPTQAIIRTEFDTVYINQPTCNGCRDCISACPFGVIHMSETKGTAQKCTFCYDRLKSSLTPACAKACPTESIRFGPLNKLRQIAETRVGQLQQLGQSKAFLYGADDKILGGLNAFYLLVDKPEVYGLPTNPKVPSRSVPRSALWAIFTSLLTALGFLFAFRGRTTGKHAKANDAPKPSAPRQSTPEVKSPSESIHGSASNPGPELQPPPESIHVPDSKPVPDAKPFAESKRTSEDKARRKGKRSPHKKPGEGTP
ncbi:MAG TPA: 4Fe-4S dicluster domain-containing protein [Gemmataceae bacterium]